MTANKLPPGRRPPTATGLMVATAAILGTGLLGACSKEHRITMAEFLEMQRAAAQAAAVEPKPDAPAVDLRNYLGPYRVGPGDIVLISVSGADGNLLFPPVRARIDREGTVELPIVGRVLVANLELEDAEDAVRKAFVPGVYKEATVLLELAAPETTEVLVYGAVTTPGLVPLRHSERNLLFALVGAGGVTEAAAGTATLRRIRRPGEEVTLRLTDPIELQAALTLPALEDGDIVHVRAATPNTVFVGGLVNRPSPQAYPSGTNVNILQALASAGGLRTDVFPREGTLIRHMPDGRDVQVKLDLRRIATGRDPNLALAAGDVLWVPDTWDTRVQDWVNRNVFLRAGATVIYTAEGRSFLNSSAEDAATGSRTVEDSFDPFGFLTRSSALRTLSTTPR